MAALPGSMEECLKVTVLEKTRIRGVPDLLLLQDEKVRDRAIAASRIEYLVIEGKISNNTEIYQIANNFQFFIIVLRPVSRSGGITHKAP